MFLKDTLIHPLLRGILLSKRRNKNKHKHKINHIPKPIQIYWADPTDIHAVASEIFGSSYYIDYNTLTSS